MYEEDALDPAVDHRLSEAVVVDGRFQKDLPRPGRRATPCPQASAVVQRVDPRAIQFERASSPGRVAGKPDFNGIWKANNTAFWDLQTHQARPMFPRPGLLP